MNTLTKAYWKKFATSSVYNNLLGNYILIAIYVSLVLLTINNIYFVIILVVYNVYIIKKYSLIFYIGVFILCLIFLNILSFKLVLPLNINNKKVIVNDVIKYENYQKIIVKRGRQKVIIYDFDESPIKPGYHVSFSLEEKEILEERIEGGFDYSDYLNKNHVLKIYTLKDYEIYKSSKNLNYIKYLLIEYIDKNFDSESQALIQGLVIGKKDYFDDNVNNSLKENGIVHLFAISGLHIGIIVLILTKVLTLFKITNKELFISIFLGIYLIVTSFTPSVVRSVIMYYLSVINKKKQLKLSLLDIISIVFLMLVIYNPYYIYNTGFILSFLVTFFIVLISPYLKKMSKLKQGLLISFFSNIITLPIIISMNNEINLLSPVTNVMYIYLISTIILPFTFLTLFLPFLNSFYKIGCRYFFQLMILTGKYLSLNITFSSLSKISISVFYYLLILIIFLNKIKKYQKVLIMSLGIYILVLSIYSPNYFENEVTFLDLNNGEATLIKSYSDECVALIDTGSGEDDEVVSFLKRKGIKKLDYLIITHNHEDHMGESDKILKKIKVNKIIISAYSNSEFKYDSKKLVKVKEGETIKCGNINMNILHPDKEYQDENDNSIVIHTKIGKYYFLFLGDSTKSVEEKISEYNILVDVVKIAHHGSSTSTSPLLLEKFNPKYAIIMSGRVKKFNFPNRKTIDTLNKYNVYIYRTDLDYSISYYWKKKHYFKKMANN